jgi:hypothetical protein
MSTDANAADITQPVISGVTAMAHTRTPRAIPITVDKAQQLEGWGLYDKMYTNVYIYSALMYLRARILEHGVMIAPAIDSPPPGTPENSDAFLMFSKAVEIASFVSSCLNGLASKRNSILNTLREMHTWTRYGQSLAEISYEYMTEGDFKGMKGLGAVRYIPRQNYRMVIDPYGPILGVIGIAPGKSIALYQGLIEEPWALDNFVPAERLMNIIVNPAESNPGGESILRPAFKPWRSFEELDPVELANLYNFAGERAWFTGPEGGETQKMIEGKLQSPNRFITELIASANSDDALTLPHGTQKMQMGSPNSPAFAEYARRRGNEMVMAILFSARTLMESTRNSQADSGQAQDVADAAVSAAQEVIAETLQIHLVRQLVILNYGRSIADKFTPRVSLRKTSAGDVPKLLAALSQASNAGLVTKPMLHALWPNWFGVEYLEGEQIKGQQTEKSPDSRSVDDDDTDEDPRGSGD